MEPAQPGGSVRQLGLVSVAVVLVVGAMGLFAFSIFGGGDEEGDESDLTIVARDSRFPEKVNAPAGTFELLVRNKDRYRHTIVIEGQGVKSELPGHKTRRVEVTLTPGTYRFFCDVTGHENMRGIIEVL